MDTQQIADEFTALCKSGQLDEASPMVNGDQFVLRFGMDVTPTGGQRMQMDEVALYTVRDGKIVEERFFY